MSGPAAPTDTSVSLVIPFAVIGVFTAAQLMLGTSPAIVAMCAGAVALPLVYLGLYGRDLYGVLGIGFSFKYAGVALAAKTFYGQTLESNLYDPYAAFGLTLLFMSVMTGVLIVARTLDRGQAFFAFPVDLVSLRRLSVISICIGIAGDLYLSVFVSARLSDAGGNSGGGAAAVLGASLANFYHLGLIAEAVYAVTKSGGRSFVTGRLALLFLIKIVIAISFNEREAAVTSLIGILSVAFLYNMLGVRHVFIFIVACSFFITVFTPITLYLRSNKEGHSLNEFVELAGSTIIKAATDPEFLKYISDTEKYSSYQDMNALMPYDYYGDRSGVLDRLSSVAWLDAVYNGTRTREPIGMAAIDQSLARAAPSFLGNKEITAMGSGDWLSWQTGLSEPGRVYYAVFGLPMEGLATWGLTGMIVYPFIFMLPVLYIYGRVSSFRLPLPVSIFLFTGTQHMMLESNSDAFLAWITRPLPVTLLCLFLLHHLIRSRAILPRARAV